ncbi:unnamed protein product [Heligmosomoides polygyrus]|uniref:Reverse transcriptase domain-containing protein n=1 Tax=Heligmosomoides polygyrus TaxID=6339 RepID=A0A183GSW9_HELPZ|nr:unnamed protein product [Heligmosomoides polygyrus]
MGRHGVKVDGRQLHYLRFADDIVHITPSIRRSECWPISIVCVGTLDLTKTMLLNLTKTMFMKNGQVSDAPFSLNGMNISDCSSYVCLGREVNMANDLAPELEETSGLGTFQERRRSREEDEERPTPNELSRRKRAAWGAFKSVEEVAKKTKNVRLRAHLFDSTVLPALIYAPETWAIRKQDEHAISVAQRGIKRTMLGVTRLTQVREGLRSSELRRRSKIRDALA